MEDRKSAAVAVLQRSLVREKVVASANEEIKTMTARNVGGGGGLVARRLEEMRIKAMADRVRADDLTTTKVLAGSVNVMVAAGGDAIKRGPFVKKNFGAVDGVMPTASVAKTPSLKGGAIVTTEQAKVTDDASGAVYAAERSGFKR